MGEGSGGLQANLESDNLLTQELWCKTHGIRGKAYRTPEAESCQFLDLVGHCSREQKGLALGRRGLDDLSHLQEETHVRGNGQAIW